MFKAYGNWVVRTRLPMLPFMRRLAKSNPSDFGKYCAYMGYSFVLVMWFKNYQMKRLFAQMTASDEMLFDEHDELAAKATHYYEDGVRDGRREYRDMISKTPFTHVHDAIEAADRIFANEITMLLPGMWEEADLIGGETDTTPFTPVVACEVHPDRQSIGTLEGHQVCAVCYHLKTTPESDS